jgi:hypothetical protein
VYLVRRKELKQDERNDILNKKKEKQNEIQISMAEKSARPRLGGGGKKTMKSPKGANFILSKLLILIV